MSFGPPATPKPSRNCPACGGRIPDGKVLFCPPCFNKLPHKEQAALRVSYVRNRGFIPESMIARLVRLIREPAIKEKVAAEAKSFLKVESFDNA